MGFLKDLNTLNRQSKEFRRNTDVGTQMADGLAAMRSMNMVMEQQVANGHLAFSGVDAVATVTAIRQTGAFVNMSPVVQLDLLVMHGAPVPVTHQEAVPHAYLPLVSPGSSVKVKVDPTDPRRLWIDWNNR